MRKRRGPGSTASAASPNGCLTSSPTVKSQTPNQPQSPTYSSESIRSTDPSNKPEDASLSRNCVKRENAESPSKSGELGALEKTRGNERERETAIVDGRDPSSPGAGRQAQSCCGRAATNCGDVRLMRERESCFSNAHCLGRFSSVKSHPKSQTLPALPTKSVSPPPHSAHLELCHRHSAHPLSELPWERPPPPPPPPLPCLLRPFYPFSSTKRTHPHNHTLPASNRLCTGEECNLFHYSSHNPGSHLSHQSLPSSPYREMFFSSLPPSSGCPCQDCFSGQEHQSASVRTFHPLHADQLESPHWFQGPGLQQTREAPDLWESETQWQVAREAEICQCKSAIPMFHIRHSTSDPTPEHPRYAIGAHPGYPSPHSLMDVPDGTSSGYHTPLQARHSCPCSSYQPSPVESHESRGYVSGYHSGSASPLPTSSPSPLRSRMPESQSESRDQLHTEEHKGEWQTQWRLCLH